MFINLVLSEGKYDLKLKNSIFIINYFCFFIVYHAITRPAFEQGHPGPYEMVQHFVHQKFIYLIKLFPLIIFKKRIYSIDL